MEKVISINASILHKLFMLGNYVQTSVMWLVMFWENAKVKCDIDFEFVC